MPPLFQSGVVGQTTSHLVSRETTDLSLGSLLSRNQSLFSPHPLPPAAHQSVPTANAQSQTGPTAGKSEMAGGDKSLSLAIQASLSSSRALLKRRREEMEDQQETENEENEENSAPVQRARNVFRSPDKEEEDKVRKQRKESEESSASSSPGSPGLQAEKSKKVGERGEEEASKTSSNTRKIVVVSPAELLGTPVPKKRRTGQVIGE